MKTEIAISEAVTDKQPVKYWMHSEQVITNGKKNPGDVNSALTFRDLLNKGYTGREVRYWLLSTHYRKRLPSHLTPWILLVEP